MNQMLPNAIVVYGASSARINPEYKEAAYRLGREIALRGMTLVSGGGRSGLMAASIEGAVEAGGRAVGVLPQFMADRGWGHPALSEVIVTDGMHSRKRTMASMTRAAIALPGGCGTLEELMEIITWRQLGLYGGNVVIADIDGYYSPLLQMLRRTIEQGFMRSDHTGLWSVAADPVEAVSLALRQPETVTFSQKIE